MALFNNRPFKLKAPYEAAGDQPTAIASITQSLKNNKDSVVLLGATGTGKTFTMANVIANIQKPTLILSHNKTLAAQLYAEMRDFFPDNAVEYFVSYYDYYQPEAYIPSTDTFIEKDSQINDEIDKLRHSATRSLLERNDVIIVSSISCIYGLGSPEAYEGMLLYLEVGKTMSRKALLNKLVEIQYKRNDIDFHRGTFRVRGDVIEVFPAYEEENAIRIEMFGDEIEAIHEFDPLRGKKGDSYPRLTLYPASHYVTEAGARKRAMDTIRDELRERLQEFRTQGRLLEAQRLESRTMFDLEMIEELGFCQGIENYSRHLTGRNAGDAPPTLIDYFPKDWLLIVDESHVTVPQIGGMYRGDRARKTSLVEHGFRLPSALDNRPLNFEEWEKIRYQTLYVSATPGDYELGKVGGEVVEQVIRPTGLLDPKVIIRKASTQVDDLLTEIKIRVEKNERVLVTVLTKKLAEDLTDFYLKKHIRVKYLHSDIETLERIQIIRDLRLGLFDVLVGINLLREGLDIPEVSLVAILDADKEGFLRSTRSLIQTMGRAARNSEGIALLYAERITDSMKAAISETERRRAIQEEHNRAHNITPQTILKAIHKPIEMESDPRELSMSESSKKGGKAKLKNVMGGSRPMSTASLWKTEDLPPLEEFGVKDASHIGARILELEQKMKDEAKAFRFEEATKLRDQVRTLKKIELTLK